MENQQIQEETITVLGKTFSSEEERRYYFRDELRKKLPELKKMEGFPIGEDEDIINLSDPPYYTACPNPWLNDFIEEWEEKKLELERQEKRKENFEVNEPYAADVSEGKNNPIYNAHSYHTKVPHPAIMRYILKYTQPGDIIFDGFAGTGMTNVAAKMCGNPTEDFKSKVVSELPNIEWGKRNSISGDLSPIASFIAYNYSNQVRIEDVQKQGKLIIEKLTHEFGWVYHTLHSNGSSKGIINFIIWSDVFHCPNCNQELILWDVAYDKEIDKIRKNVTCENCHLTTPKNKLIKTWETKYDADIDQTVKVAKIVPVEINYTLDKKRYTKKPDEKDLALIDKISNYPINAWFPKYILPQGFNTSQPNRSHGISRVHQFHMRRNLLILSEFWKEAEKISDFRISSVLKLSASAANLNFSRMRRFRAGKKGGGPLTGTLYVSSIITPQNALKSISRNIQFVLKAYNLLNTSETGNTLTFCGSANDVNLKSNSIDYIFTDPPFGANIMYSELNIIWESWLKVVTNNKQEVIENKFQKKSTLDYQNLMAACFREYFRVLKPGKWMTVEFSNTSAAVWNGIQTAIQNAGFVVANLAAIDKKQGSFKAVTTVTAVKQDLVISCYKPSSEFDQKFKQHQSQSVAVWEFVEEHLNHLPIHLVKNNATTAIIERSPKILYDRLIAYYVQKNLPVPIDAGKFQQGLRERFAERDGMFFSQEQVQEYDKKKADVPDFVQLSILVSSEQDGVLWLKNLLQEKQQTYQDIHPQWMQALAGVRKGDIIPELSDILEENFLKNASGKWYVPDPENEADLEKLRNKRLLRQYEEYKKEALKPKGKIKEARVEALRAGFKLNYQDKDFKSIVIVGDKIPNQLLMEDEVLLQFYDIAATRV